MVVSQTLDLCQNQARGFEEEDELLHPTLNASKQTTRDLNRGKRDFK